MPYRPFSTVTTAQLLEWLAAAQSDKAAGASTVSGNEGEASFQDQVDVSPDTRIREIMFELSARDPVTYPAASFRAPTRTRAVFSSEGI